MLAKARSGGCYDAIHQADIAMFLSQRLTTAREGGEGVDAIVLADVLVYFGDLRNTLMACEELLVEAGLLVFTVEDLVANRRGAMAVTVEQGAVLQFLRV